MRGDNVIWFYNLYLPQYVTFFHIHKQQIHIFFHPKISEVSYRFFNAVIVKKLKRREPELFIRGT